jgi:hypothetical protein
MERNMRSNRKSGFVNVAVLAVVSGLGLGAQQSDVQIIVKDGYRYITSNGIPDHQPGQFPNRGNPNSVREQRHSFRVPASPQAAPSLTPMERQPFGVALNGVPFDPGTAEYWQNDFNSGWRYDALSGFINLGLDAHHAHVQPTGAYHYHGLPTGLIGDSEGMKLIGWAADGFPIYAQYGLVDGELKKLKSSWQLKEGKRSSGPGATYDGTFVEDWEYKAGSGDLDQCNGTSGVTPEFPEGTYYYVVTEEYPMIPRFFRGTPDPSFGRRGPGGPPPRGHRPPPRRRRGGGGGTELA